MKLLNPQVNVTDLYIFLSKNAINQFTYPENTAATEKCNNNFGLFWASDARNKML